MFTVALVTYAGAPALTADDALLQRALHAHGVATEAVVWSSGIDWGRFDLVLLRSTWDYYLRMEEFAAWLDMLERLAVPVLNPLPALRWNCDKRYLLELQADGIEIVPTVFLPPDAAGPSRETSRSLGGILSKAGWADAVVKPAISAAAHETWRTSMATAERDEPRFRALRSAGNGGVLVQPFMEEVVREGEWSLVFLDGAFSHAAIKRPLGGDFRVQQEHGGSYAPASAPPGLVADAARAVAASAVRARVEPANLAYARVDGVARSDGSQMRLVLMELECVEPSLFFLQEPAAADRMAGALLARLRASTGGVQGGC